LSASITFEQLYGGVEGDSASSAELFALLSSLADIPIDQGLAVTGSVNQKGEIQPVGGINEKIEGWFETCKILGMTGTQGVVIPRRNLYDLMLNDEVLEAFLAKRFLVYAIDRPRCQGRIRRGHRVWPRAAQTEPLQRRTAAKRQRQ